MCKSSASTVPGTEDSHDIKFINQHQNISLYGNWGGLPLEGIPEEMC